LSKRQSELVGLLTQGLKNKEIGAALGISEGTVKAYLTTLYEKVGARDRFELALFGLKNMGGRENASAGGPIRSLVARRGVVRRPEA
jgi:two-component system nitrate/nitrite response regulator NarP